MDFFTRQMQTETVFGETVEPRQERCECLMIRAGYYYFSAVGVLISKAIHGLLTSPKKQGTNLFYLLFYSSLLI
jgi:hypothetical protein